MKEICHMVEGFTTSPQWLPAAMGPSNFVGSKASQSRSLNGFPLLVTEKSSPALCVGPAVLPF